MASVSGWMASAVGPSAGHGLGAGTSCSLSSRIGGRRRDGHAESGGLQQHPADLAARVRRGVDVQVRLPGNEAGEEGCLGTGTVPPCVDTNAGL